MTKKRVYDSGDTKELKKYGCAIFLKQNYNLNIPAVANALSKQYREIR